LEFGDVGLCAGGKTCPPAEKKIIRARGEPTKDGTLTWH